MNLALPEELTREQIHLLVCEIQAKHPKVFADLVDLKYVTAVQKLKILDNMLMDHPDLYCSFFTVEEPER